MRVLGQQFGRILVLVTALLMVSSIVAAQTSGTAITVLAAAESSIQITFSQAIFGCALTPAPDYSNVIMNLGSYDNNGNNTGCGFYAQNSPSAGRYTISTWFNVQVDKFNSGSASYNLRVRLQSPPPGPASAVTYQIRQGLFGSQVTLTTTPQQVITNGNYGSDSTQVLSIQVNTATAPVGMLSRTIEYSAVAN